MADADPIAALSLERDERVLWQGRPPLGAPWPDAATLVRAGLRAWFVVATMAAGAIVATVLVAACGLLPWWIAAVTIALPLLAAGAAGALLAVVFVVIAASKHAGPFYGAFVALGLWGPSFAFFWANLVAAHGWSGALARLKAGDVVGGSVLIALPLARLALGVTGRLALLHVITDRRVAELRGSRLLWWAPRDDLRVERTWRSPGGHLVVGSGTRRHELHVRDDPARVLDDVTALAPPG